MVTSSFSKSFGDQILNRGFLDVWFSSLQDVVLVGLITCERIVQGKATTSWKMKLMGRQEGQDDKREKMVSKERKMKQSKSQNKHMSA